ncbi:MAG: hypothetical protein HUU55_16595 [Myxococcales bacterium]|nr:hypothetical protein [Myxococcales bacterium]
MDSSALKKLGDHFKGGKVGWILPIVALILLLVWLFSDASGVVEIEPGEVAVLYNNTGLGVFGEPARVINEQGAITFLPGLNRVEKLEIRPQILVMEGEQHVDVDHTRKLTVRANDGSNFYFDKLEIHYQVVPGSAIDVLGRLGPDDSYKLPILVHSREVLRDAFGQHSFLEVANPATYGQATSAAKEALNERLRPLGIEVTNIPPPKPTFDERVEHAIEERQNAEQEVEVQAEKRQKLEQEKGRKLQHVEQTKNQEYQQLISELEAKKQQAANKLIAVKREADLYKIERDAEANAYRDEKVTRAKANETAYRREAEGLAAKINAVGEQGPDVLNRVIAEKVFAQLGKLVATPVSNPSSPIDIRYLEDKR